MSTLGAELEEASKIVELYAHSWGARGHAIIEKNSMEFAAALRARAAHVRELERKANEYTLAMGYESRTIRALTGPLNPDSAGGTAGGGGG